MNFTMTIYISVTCAITLPSPTDAFLDTKQSNITGLTYYNLTRYISAKSVTFLLVDWRNYLFMNSKYMVDKFPAKIVTFLVALKAD